MATEKNLRTVHICNTIQTGAFEVAFYMHSQWCASFVVKDLADKRVTQYMQNWLAGRAYDEAK